METHNQSLAHPLTQHQTSIWLDEMLYPNNTLYNLGGYFEIKGALNTTAFGEAIQKVIGSNTIFGTTISQVGDTPTQTFALISDYELAYYDYSNRSSARRDCIAQIKSDFEQPIVLSTAPLFDFALYKIADKHYFWYVKIHHILLDGWGLSLFLDQVSKQYACSTTRSLSVGSELIEFRDYLPKEATYLESEQFEKDKSYWLKKFETIPNSLHTNSQKKQVQQLADTAWFIPEALQEKINAFANAQQVSLPQFWMSVLSIYFHKMTRNESICIGLPVHNRQTESDRQTLGLFVGMIPHLVTLESTTTFAQILQQVKQTRRADRPHQQFPLPHLVAALPQEEVQNRGLFDLVVSFDQHSYSLPIEELDSHFTFLRGGQEKTPLTLYLRQANLSGQVELSFEFLEAYYSKMDIELMIGRLNELLENLLAFPQENIATINLLPSSEKALILETFNDTKRAFPANESIITSFERQVHARGQEQALMFGDRIWTYAQLNEKANEMAHYLLENHAIQVNDIIAVQMQRSDWMIITILGILKAGGCYLPLPTDAPSKRRSYILQESSAKLLICDKQVGLSDTNSLPIVPFQRMHSSKRTNPNLATGGENLAYIMFTSGSTGTPKGVCISHKSVLRLVKNSNFAQMDSEQVFLHLAQVAFDASTFEIWGALLNGGKLVVMPYEQPSLAQIKTVIQQYQVSTLWLTAGLFHLMVEYGLDGLSSLRQVLAGGDVLSATHIKKAIHDLPQCTFINGYGPTENTTFTTTCRLNDLKTVGASVPIGKPISNTAVYILDEQQQLVPVGAKGELYTGGAGLATAYLNNPELTAEKFISNPFKAGERLYRTGDLAAWQADGNIEFLGRKDFQLKIRGFRIETVEIEQALLLHPEVKSTVVLGKMMEQGKELVAYFTTSINSLESNDLRTFLQAHLPKYMLPSYFVKMEDFPLKATGKIDRKALPEPQSAKLQPSYLAPQTPLEQKLAELWAELLDIADIGLSDHFFELGGHSLRAVKLVAMIQEHLGVSITVGEIFSHPKLEQLAATIASKETSRISSIPTIETSPTYTISHAQSRLWTLDQFEQDQTAYNMPFSIRIQADVNVQILEKAFQEVINRHEILRTAFVKEAGDVRQLIQAKDQFQLDCQLLLEASTAEVEAYVKKYASHAFDLASGKLLKVQLVKLGLQDYLLLVNMHHIISDGWSNGILFEELEHSYNAYLADQNPTLPILSIQYKDFAVWQNGQLAQEGIVTPLRDYWVDKLSEVKSLELPTDFQRPPVKTFEGASLDFILSHQQVNQLNTLGKTDGSTLFMVLTTLVKVLLYRYTGQTNICIGTPSSGRIHPDLQNQIGFYVNTLALRDDLDEAATFRNNLAKIKTTTLAAFENELYPFDCIVEDLGGARDRSRSPLFDVMVVLQNNEQYSLRLGTAQTAIEMVETSTSKFDLTFCFSPCAQGLKMNIEYATTLFKASRIKRMASHFKCLLDAVVTHQELAISQLDLLDQSEKQLLRSDFNHTAALFPAQKTVVQLFEEQVSKTPERIALRFGQETLTYQTLNEQSNRFANGLQQHFDIRANDIIAIQAERGIDMLIAIWGILKTGAAYLPISADFPQKRLEYVLKDSHARLLIRDKACIEKLGQTQELLPIIEIKSIQCEKVENPVITTTSEDLAYIIYTSGSTGQPKGVAISHQAMINYLYWANAYYFDHSMDYDLPLHASVAFDMSITTLFSPLLRGAAIDILPERAAATNLKAIFQANTVKAVKLTPSHIDMLAMLDLKTTAIEKVIVGGEALQDRQLQTLFQLNPDMQVYNEYGPTEATVGCIVKTLTAQDQTITIGQPISNTEIHIIDKNGQIAPIGVMGEICISGASLAQGYLNKTALTAAKFVESPFKTGERLYKTGDLACWLETGEIKYYGRIDHQIKIRGYRIEVGEIEKTLLAQNNIQNAVVQVQQENTEVSLIAYLLTKQATDLNIAQLRTALADELPKYMMPNQFVFVAQFPLTESGKIDRKALSALNLGSMESTIDVVAPKTKTEERLLAIWQQVLGLEQISIEDDFFEIGGHSLKAIRLMSRIQEEMELTLPMQLLFQYTSIQQLATQIDTLSAYNSNYESAATGIRFNADATPTIFAFPPFLGLGIGFQQLANCLEDYGFYCFDFLEAEDKLERYYQQMKSEQAEGPYTILGYSAGGNLAYEFVAYLEAKGEEVAALIFMDSAVWPSVPLSYVDRFFDKLENRLTRGSTELDESFGDYLQNKTIRQQTTKRLLAYRDFLNDIQMEHQIHTNIYQILAEIDSAEMTDRLRWMAYTKGTFEVFHGVGAHEDMCAQNYVTRNAERLASILKSLEKEALPKFPSKNYCF